MTEKQAEVVRALADNNMVIRYAARSLGKNEGTIRCHIDKIRDTTGLNPLNFRDLNELLRELDTKTYRCTCKICGAKFKAPDHHYRICSDACRAVAKERSDANYKAKALEYRQTQKEHKRAHARVEEARRMRDLEEVGELKKPAPAMSLAEASKRARAMGLSYGQYMTLMRERGLC